MAYSSDHVECTASDTMTSESSTPIKSPIKPESLRNGTVTPSVRFEGLGDETLRIGTSQISCPQTSSVQTRHILLSTGLANYLPGQPRVPLLSLPSEGPNAPEDKVLPYLRDSHLTTELDKLLPFMKYIFVQTPSYRHITHLHHQEARDRRIIVDEHPGLHLVWYYDRIFVKPIPAYFFSSEFWTYLHDADRDVHRASVGFMRTYTFLIRYGIDYELACHLKLIPRTHKDPRDPDGPGKHPTYEQFCRFIGQFSCIEDADTCRRYHYGELRLTRVNRTALFTKGSLAYFHIYPQWGSYLRQFFAPIIMVLGGCSVVLNAMQVNLNAQELLEGLNSNWSALIRASLYFPVIIIFIIAGILALAVLGLVVMALQDIVKARQTRRKKKKGRDTGQSSHGRIW